MSDTAIAIIVTGVCNAALAIAGSAVTVLTLWIKAKYGEDKTRALTEGQTKVLTSMIDDTTSMVKTTGTVAAANARVAATAASDARATTAHTAAAVKEISGKLNGGVDSAIRNAIEPVQKVIADHAEADEKNVREVNEKLERLEGYVHERQHEVLNVLQVQANRLERLIQLAEERPK